MPFAKGRDVLEVRTTFEPWWVNARGQGGHLEGPQQAATPISITKLWDEDTEAFIVCRYTYRLFEDLCNYPWGLVRDQAIAFG